MSSQIAVLYQSAQPAAGSTHDLLTESISQQGHDDRIAEMRSRGWSVVSDAQARTSPQDGNRLIPFWVVTFARPKYGIGTQLLWHRPTQEPESPIQTMPCFVMGQYADGPYQLFVCSFQGAHMQVAPPEQLTPMPDPANEVIQMVAESYARMRGDLAYLRESHDVASEAAILMEGRMAGLEARLEALESAATDPHKAGKKGDRAGS